MGAAALPAGGNAAASESVKYFYLQETRNKSIEFLMTAPVNCALLLPPIKRIICPYKAVFSQLRKEFHILKASLKNCWIFKSSY